MKEGTKMENRQTGKFPKNHKHRGLLLGVCSLVFLGVLLTGCFALGYHGVGAPGPTVPVKDEAAKSQQLPPEKQQSLIDNATFFVRKAAHLTEFASLGVLLCAFAFTFGEKFRYFLFSFLFGVFYAGTDEFHQLFVDGRSGQLSDVLVDTTGVLLGMAVFYFVVRIVVKIRQKHTS